MATSIVAPSSTSWLAAEKRKMVSNATAVRRLAITAAPTPTWMSRRRRAFAGLDEERDQRADEKDRLEPLAQQDDERLHEEIGPGHRLPDHALGARQVVPSCRSGAS